MKSYTKLEAAEILKKHYSTLANWVAINYFVPDAKQKGVWKFTEKQLNNYIYDEGRKTVDKRLVVLSLHEEISESNLELLKLQFINNCDDKCELKEIHGVAEEDLLYNEDFMKLIGELSGKYIYRLVVFKKDFKDGSIAFNYLELISEQTRTSLKFVGGEDDSEE